MNDMNGMIGELTENETKEYMDGVTKLLPPGFTHHGSPDAIKVITEEFKLDLMEAYPDKKIIASNEDKRMIRIKVLYGKSSDTEWQKKTFKDEISCVEWCRKNSEKICCINDYRTGFQPISHFEIMDAINGKSN